MKKYTISILLWLTLPTVLIGLFNWVINPYNFFTASPILAGFNIYKPIEDDRQYKAYKVIKEKPDAIILGSSRSLLIPAEHESLQGYSSYNLALSGASGYETLRYFQHANAEGKLKRVILGIGEDFTSGKMPNYAEERLSSYENGDKNYYQFKGYYIDLANSLFSIKAFKDSIRTIQRQHEGDYNVFSDKHIATDILNFNGQHNLFIDKEKAFVRKIKKEIRNENCTNMNNNNPAISYAEYTHFHKAVDMAYQSNIDLHLFFYPVHSRLYEIYCAAGYWTKVEQTKRAVVNIVNDLASKYNKPPFVIWDFSGYNRITTEPYPAQNDIESIMQWYIDPIHYSKKTGTLVLDRMFNYTDEYSDFGHIVSAENIEQHLLMIREQRVVYAQNNAGIVNEINLLVRAEFNNKSNVNITLSSGANSKRKISPTL